MAAAPRLAVCLHRVEPDAFDSCIRAREWLRARGVERLTMLVVPAPRLHPFDVLRPDLAEWLRDRSADGDAVAQHGFRHELARVPPLRRVLRARLAGVDADEFAALDAEEAAASVDAGRAILVRAGLTSRGFVAPSYCYTGALRRALRTRADWWADPAAVHRRGGATIVSPTLTANRSAPLLGAAPAAAVELRGALDSGVVRVDVDPRDLEDVETATALARLLHRAADHGTRAVTYDELAGAAPQRDDGMQAPAPSAALAR